MSVNFVTSGQKTFVEKIPDGIRNLKLKAKIYSLEYSKDNGFFLLDIAEKYTLPNKIYGNYKAASNRIINTYHSKKNNTGILLTGLKGSGKSLFVKFIANAMIDLDVPVLQINKPYQGDEMFNFIENIGNCVIIFDEFGKNYDSYIKSNAPTQAGLLSILDGLGNSKRLHLFTENNVGYISDYLVNRPGRVHYHFKYNRLNDDIIKEYCKDLNIPNEVVSELLELCNKIKVLSFDIISCLINEWKLYGGKLTDHIDILNMSLCNDPNNKNIEVISYTKKDGTKLNNEHIKIDYSDDLTILNLSMKSDDMPKFQYLDTVRTEDAISVNNDIYEFLNNLGDRIILKIKLISY